MNRLSPALPSLVLALALTGCASSPSPAEAPRGAQATEADATAFRQGQAQQALNQQIQPPLDKPLRLQEFAEPRYPSYMLSDYRPSARATVVVSFEVLPSGYVGTTRVLSDTDSDLNKAAMSAVRSWRFEPPLRDGKPARLFLQHSFRMGP